MTTDELKRWADIYSTSECREASAAAAVLALIARVEAAEARIGVLEKAARRVLERCPVCDDGREDAECICTELVSARMVELEAALARKG